MSVSLPKGKYGVWKHVFMKEWQNDGIDWWNFYKYSEWSRFLNFIENKLGDGTDLNEQQIHLKDELGRSPYVPKS